MERGSDPHMEDRAKDIAASIDAGKPVLAYPTPQKLDMGVIYGYQDGGKTWLVRDYFAKDGTTLVPVEKLGPMMFIPKEFKSPMPRRQAILACLKMAVKHWGRGRGPTEKDPYLYGKAALEQWARDIALVDDPAAKLTEQERGSLFFLGWWNQSQWCDARQAAVGFLNKAAAEIGGEAGKALERAAQEYQKEVAMLSSVFAQSDAFLGPWSGKTIADWTPAVRAREKAMIAKAAEHEKAAVAEIEKALTVMKTKE